MTEGMALEEVVAMLEARLAELEKAAEDREGEMASLREKLGVAAGKYRALLLQGAPEIPQELVSGKSIEEVEESYLKAQEVVAKVRSKLEAMLLSQRVPAGAPPRAAPDLSALAPKEKILHGLSRR